MNNLFKALILSSSILGIFNSTSYCMEDRNNSEEKNSLNKAFIYNNNAKYFKENNDIELIKVCKKYPELNEKYNSIINRIEQFMKEITSHQNKYNKLINDTKLDDVLYKVQHIKIEKTFAELLGYEYNGDNTCIDLTTLLELVINKLDYLNNNVLFLQENNTFSVITYNLVKHLNFDPYKSKLYIRNLIYIHLSFLKETYEVSENKNSLITIKANNNLKDVKKYTIDIIRNLLGNIKIFKANRACWFSSNCMNVKGSDQLFTEIKEYLIQELNKMKSCKISTKENGYVINRNSTTLKNYNEKERNTIIKKLIQKKNVMKILNDFEKTAFNKVNNMIDNKFKYCTLTIIRKNVNDDSKIILDNVDNLTADIRSTKI